MAKNPQAVHRKRTQAREDDEPPAAERVLPDLIRVHAVLHVSGKQPGMTLCGVGDPGAEPHPIIAATVPPDARIEVLEGLPDALANAVAAFHGQAAPCRGCLANVARMAASASAKAGGEAPQRRG